MKKITIEWLESKNACIDGYNWFVEQGKEVEPIPLLYLLIKENQLEWANWLVVRVMDYSQYVSYAVYAAEQVIDIFEKEFPDDKRPREAIEAAKRCIENPSDENKKEAANAASAAGSASDSASDWAAWAADSAALSAWSASSAAARAADNAALAADRAAARAAALAADRAACAAYWAAWAADSAKILKKILKYGIKLLREGK